MKVVLGIFAGFSVLLGLIFWLTGDISKAGDDFFAAVQKDDIDAAYELLSDDFQAGTSKEELESYLAANALDNVKETSWSSRSISGATGELEGTVTTAGGSKISLKLNLINSETGWRINQIEKASAGFKDSTDSRSVPSANKQRQLFRDTNMVFAESLSDQSMTRLREHSARKLRQKASVEDLDQAFGSFFQDGETFLRMTKLVPIMDSAKVNETNGVLAIRGHYPVEPSPVHFEHAYIYEGVDWRLFGLALNVGSAPE